ncbi:MAG: CDP-alcohol phosphatidyltransferase family protein [Ruthenibacterium lactatiformans]
MNLPNKLTMLRVLLIPVFMVCAANRWMLAAGIIFAAASLTDYFDGHLARKNNLVTDFGKFADPLADKLLTTTAFLYMLVDGVCDPVVLAIILAREFAVSGLRMVSGRAGRQGHRRQYVGQGENRAANAHHLFLLLWLCGGGRVFRAPGAQRVCHAGHQLCAVLGGGGCHAHFRGKISLGQPAFHQYGKIIMRGGMPPVPNRNGKSGRAGGFPCGRF